MYKVFVVDDEYRVKERLLDMAQWQDSSYIFCGEASDGEMALSLINEMKPDIVISDIEMPFMNGLELASILKATMPWIRVIFLSGYDDFEYAKEALKIGVSDYLLKPFRFEELKVVMDQVVESIENEKKYNLDIVQMKNKLESVKALKLDNFFEHLIAGRFDTRELMEEYKNFDIDILAKAYVVLDVKITSTTDIDYVGIKQFCLNQLDKIKSALWYYRTDDRIILILKSDNGDVIKEQAFSIAGTILHEVTKSEGHTATIGIGNIVSRMRLISDSCKNANKARTYLGDLYLGQILYIDDINSQMIEVDEGRLESDLKISRLELEDVDEYVKKHLDASENASGLMNYYKVINIIFECVDIVTRLGGEAKEVLPMINEKEIVQLYATKKSELFILIKDYLIRTIEYKQSNGGNKYHDIIAKAKDYIHKYFGEPSISLNSVAKEVNLSPNHFSMIFSNETNHTFIEYLTKTRINKAKALLETSKKKLADIAYEVGYNEPQYFSYIFKKNIGISPRDYRTSMK